MIGFPSLFSKPASEMGLSVVVKDFQAADAMQVAEWEKRLCVFNAYIFEKAFHDVILEKEVKLVVLLGVGNVGSKVREMLLRKRECCQVLCSVSSKKADFGKDEVADCFSVADLLRILEKKNLLQKKLYFIDCTASDAVSKERESFFLLPLFSINRSLRVILSSSKTDRFSSRQTSAQGVGHFLCLANWFRSSRRKCFDSKVDNLISCFFFASHGGMISDGDGGFACHEHSPFVAGIWRSYCVDPRSVERHALVCFQLHGERTQLFRGGSVGEKQRIYRT